MNNKKKAGRPRNDDLTNHLKVTVDSKTADAIKRIAASKSKSQAYVLREVIPIVSSKNFEEMLPNIALEQLQKFSNECWTQLHTPNSIFETEHISEFMPAFITTWDPPIVHVKFPTYNIHIYDKNDPTKMTNQPDVEQVLSSIPLSLRSKTAYTPINFLIMQNGVAEIKSSYVNEVMCLSCSLETNRKTKDGIISLLKQSHYDYSVYPSYCIRGEYIELIDNGKYFKIIPQSTP